MKTRLDITLFGQWNEEQELCLWGEGPSGEMLPALELKLMLFARDAATFFGAFAPVWEDGPLKGVKLGAEELLRFLTELPANPLAALRWSDPLRQLADIAPELQTALERGEIMPSIGEEGLRWKLAGGADAGRRYSLLEQALAQGGAAADWTAALMHARLGHDAAKRQALRRMERWLKEQPDEENGAAPHNGRLAERDLLLLSGWNETELPFVPGFRLEDPAQGKTAWKLSYVLIDRVQSAFVSECLPDGTPSSDMPEAWRVFAGTPEALLSAWLRAVPFLRADGESDQLRTSLNDEDAWLFLTQVSGQITEWGGTVLLPSWWNRLRATRPKLKAHVASSFAGEAPLFGLEQMMHFDWKLAIGNIELTEEEFLAIAASQKSLHYIRGEWISLDPALTQRIKRVMERSKRKKGIPLKDVLLREFGKSGRDNSLFANDDDDLPDWEVEAGGAMLDWLRRLDRKETVPQTALSPNFRGELRPYQLEGLSWLVYLRRFGLGGCLADDMGLGKTIQYIAYLLHIKDHQAPSAPSLLICPTSLVGNWQKELERFAPNLRVLLHYGADRAKDAKTLYEAAAGCDLVITTYMTAMLDIGLLQPMEWNSLCLDEAQNMKNAHTKQASAIRRFHARHRIAMTGTPVENRLSELWSIIDFTNPGYLGSLSSFQRHYGKLAERNKGQAAEQLRRLVRPFILRRMKSDPRIVPDLPEKLENKVYVPLTKEQAALYENVLDRLFSDLDRRTGFDRRGKILAALTQLKQICDHPALFTKDTSAAGVAPRRSHKAMRLVEMVGEVRTEGERCLIFTQYVEMGTLLVRMLERALKEPVLYLHGGISKLQRDRMVERFQSGTAEESGTDSAPGIFVLSLRAGGTGLNLTAANHVFHYDRWWNPAVENQATDRAYRIGQERLVQVHKFVSLGTLEERIDEMIERKQSLSRDIIDSGENWITELSTDELEDVFALRKSWVEG